MQGEEKSYISSARDLQQRMKGRGIKDKPNKDLDELRPEYDFDYSEAVLGKY